VKQISCAQAGKTGADDHNGLGGLERTRGDASDGGRGERKPTRHLLKKSSAIHVTLAERRISHFTSESDIEQQPVRRAPLDSSIDLLGRCPPFRFGGCTQVEGGDTFTGKVSSDGSSLSATGSGHWICQRDFTIPAAGSVDGDMTTTLSIQKQ